MVYEILTQESIPLYISKQPLLSHLIDSRSIVSIREVGDGNLNFVFVVGDSLGRSIVLKQALPYMRLVGPDWPMSPQRALQEGSALQVQARWAASNVPMLYLIDEDMFVLAMEDLSDHTVWRTNLNSGGQIQGVASQLGAFIATMAFRTSPFTMSGSNFRQSSARAVNSELCAISEDLIFTEPYIGSSRNSVLPANAEDLEALIEDTYMCEQMAIAKWLFLTTSEALIHGDLHTGSVMVRSRSGSIQDPSVKVFDPEFSFFGPIAFDLGMLWANFTIAAARAVAMCDDVRGKWCLQMCLESWESFTSTFRTLCTSHSGHNLFEQQALEARIRCWEQDAILFASAEMCRRVVGLAKVTDLEELEPSLREGAARGLLQAARESVRIRSEGAGALEFTNQVWACLLSNSTRPETKAI